MEVFPTGLRGIDQDLHLGGLPAGSLVCVEYPPASAGEAFFWTLVARGFHPDVHLPVATDETTFVRPDRVVYLTTGKAPAAIADGLSNHTPDPTTDGVEIPIEFERVDTRRSDVSLSSHVPDPDVDRPAFVVDSASDVVEFAGGDEARALLAEIRPSVRERGGLALLSFARGRRRWHPTERHFLQRCDAHVRFEPGEGEASAAVRFAHVRGAVGPVEGFPAVFNLDVGRRVSVDTVERS